MSMNKKYLVRNLYIVNKIYPDCQNLQNMMYLRINYKLDRNYLQIYNYTDPFDNNFSENQIRLNG